MKADPKPERYVVTITATYTGYANEILLKQSMKELDVPAMIQFINRPHAVDLPKRPRGWKKSLDRKTNRVPKQTGI